jgi:hypothetical protein
MAHIFLTTVLYTVLVAAFLSALLKLFGTEFAFRDAVLAAVVASLLSLIPTVGGAISVIGIIAVVYWRATEVSIPVLLLASALSRLISGALLYKFV